MKLSAETTHEVWNDEIGSHWEIGPDRDGLGLVEIRCYDPDNLEPVDRLVFEPEVATMIAEAMVKAVAEIPKK